MAPPQNQYFPVWPAASAKQQAIAICGFSHIVQLCAVPHVMGLQPAENVTSSVHGTSVFLQVAQSYGRGRSCRCTKVGIAGLNCTAAFGFECALLQARLLWINLDKHGCCILDEYVVLDARQIWRGTSTSL